MTHRFLKSNIHRILGFQMLDLISQELGTAGASLGQSSALLEWGAGWGARLLLPHETQSSLPLTAETHVLGAATPRALPSVSPLSEHQRGAGLAKGCGGDMVGLTTCGGDPMGTGGRGRRLAQMPRCLPWIPIQLGTWPFSLLPLPTARGTNPFATVKLRPTVTNDRSAPLIH